MEELKWTGERLVTSVENKYFMYEHLHRYALAHEISKDKIILDIACGEGYGSYLISQSAAYVYGVDIDSSSVEHARNKYEKVNGNLSFKTGSTSNIPLQDNCVDMVVSFETIEHHDEHEQMMKEIKRVLKKDGVLLISSPNKLIYNQIAPNNPFHIKELHFNEFCTLLEAYFSCCKYYQQRFVAGSLITPLENNATGFETFEGDYSAVNKSLTPERYFNSPYYNLAVCSDGAMPEDMGASFFNGAKAVVNMQDQMLEKGREQIKKSSSYKFGNWFVRKLSFLRMNKDPAK